MESDSPANKNLQPDGTAASPTPIRLNTPDPHEATQPLRITMVQDVVPQEKTASEPAKELEETRPILVRQPRWEAQHLKAPPSTSSGRIACLVDKLRTTGNAI